MLKFQVRPATSSVASTPAPSSCCSPSSSASIKSQRLSQLSSSSSASSSDFLSSDQSVDRSIDELEEYILHRTTSKTEVKEEDGHRQIELIGGVTSARFRRRAPSPSPSLPSSLLVISAADASLSSSVASSPSASFNSSIAADGGTNCSGSRKPGPFPPIPPKPSHLATMTMTKVKRAADLGVLRVYTAQIKADTDYKTLRVSALETTGAVVRQLVLEKLRLSLRDLNLFHLFMEVRTRRADGTEARSIIELDRTARPLELQKCHPDGMSRFILGMDSNAILARIFDGEVCPESNYKSVLISRRTSCAEVLQMLRQMCRLGEAVNIGGHQHHSFKRSSSSIAGSVQFQQQQHLGLEAISELRLFVTDLRGTQPRLIPFECALAGLYLSLLPGQRIVLRRVIVPRCADAVGGGER